MFQFNRDLAASNIDWKQEKRLYYLEAWSFTNVRTATSWNLRSGTLENSQIEEWLGRTGSFSIPAPPSDVGTPDGGIRLLACHYTLFKKVSLGMSHQNFKLVESMLGLHPATLPALEVASGAFSRHFDSVAEGKKEFSIILKAPQKYEIGNYMLSLTHDITSRWTTALLAGESIIPGVEQVYDLVRLPLESISPCAVIRAYLTPSTALWNHPLTLPCIVLSDHLKRLQHHCTDDLVRRVMFIEEQLGVTRVGRRQSEPLSRSLNAAGKPVERPRAEYLTVNINTQLTRLLFTGLAPKWNYEASELMMSVMKEIVDFRGEPADAASQISGVLEHNRNLASSIENNILGLQKRLELQMNVLYSFVAQTDNQLSARLAATSGRDSTSMKILAFITTIFLPGTYVATLFSMNMFNWDAGSNTGSSDSDSPTVSSRFWIYWVVSAPLTAITLGGWALWWSFEKHRYDAHIEDTVKSAAEIKPPWWRKVLKGGESSSPVAYEWPEIPGEEHRNVRMRVIRDSYVVRDSEHSAEYRGRRPKGGRSVSPGPHVVRR